MPAPTTDKQKLMRVKFVSFEPKVVTKPVTREEKSKATEVFPDFWTSLSDSEKNRFRALKEML